jgi:hypothetical protein
LGPNILLDILFLSTLKLCTFLRVTDQVSHPYKTIKGKGKVVPVHAMKAYRGSRGIALLILNFSAIWR